MGCWSDFAQSLHALQGSRAKNRARDKSGHWTCKKRTLGALNYTTPPDTGSDPGGINPCEGAHDGAAGEKQGGPEGLAAQPPPPREQATRDDKKRREKKEQEGVCHAMGPAHHHACEQHGLARAEGGLIENPGAHLLPHRQEDQGNGQKGEIPRRPDRSGPGGLAARGPGQAAEGKASAREEEQGKGHDGGTLAKELQFLPGRRNPHHFAHQQPHGRHGGENQKEPHDRGEGAEQEEQEAPSRRRSRLWRRGEPEAPEGIQARGKEGVGAQREGRPLPALVHPPEEPFPQSKVGHLGQEAHHEEGGKKGMEGKEIQEDELVGMGQGDQIHELDEGKGGCVKGKEPAQ